MTAIRAAQHTSTRPTKPNEPHTARQSQITDGSTSTRTESKQDRLVGPGATSGTTDTFLEPSKPGKKPLVDGKLLITGGRYGDTFGADRINAGAGGGSMITSRNDQVSTTFGLGDEPQDVSTVVDVHKQATPEKNDKPEKTDQKKDPAWVDFPRKRATVRDNPMSDDSGGFRPVTRDELNREKKHLGKNDDGGNDGRGDVDLGSGGWAQLPVGQDDHPDVVRSGGKLNLDRVLAINTLVNPSRI